MRITWTAGAALLAALALSPPGAAHDSVDIRTALRSYTISAAHSLFLDARTGSIEAGKDADLAVWDRNPYQVPTPALKEMRCEMTLLKGKIVYRR